MRPTLVLLLAAAAASPWPAPPAAAEGDPPVQDNRFFPKEMEDALAALKLPDPEESFNAGLAALARLRGRDGALEPMRETAFPVLLEYALSTRLEHAASYAGEVLAALDGARLVRELQGMVDRESAGPRMFSAAVLLEEVAWSAGADFGS